MSRMCLHITYIGEEEEFWWDGTFWFTDVTYSGRDRSISNYPPHLFTIESSGVMEGDDCECGGEFVADFYDDEDGDLYCPQCDTYDFELPMSDARNHIRTKWEGSRER